MKELRDFKSSDSLVVSGTLVAIALGRILSIRDLYILGNFFQSFGQQLVTIAAQQQLFRRTNPQYKKEMISILKNKEFITKEEYSQLMNKIKEIQVKIDEIKNMENGSD